MTITPVTICNRALDFLGHEDTIVALDNTKKAGRLFMRNYALARDLVVGAFPWNSATARDALPALTSTPAWGYEKQYQLPEDCLTVFMIEDEDITEIDHRIEGRKILCNLSAPLNILYARRVDDPGSLHPGLAEAISAKLAADIAYALTGSRSLANDMEVLFKAKRAEAYKVDSREGGQQRLTANDWTVARVQDPGGWPWRG
jgi:hypothetical protein